MRRSLIFLVAIAMALGMSTDFPSRYTVDIEGTLTLPNANGTAVVNKFLIKVAANGDNTRIETANAQSNLTVLNFYQNGSRYHWDEKEDSCRLGFYQKTEDDSNILVWANRHSESFMATCKEGMKPGRVWVINFPRLGSSLPWANQTNMCASADGKTPYFIAQSGPIGKTSFKNFKTFANSATPDARFILPAKCHAADRLNFPSQYSFKFGSDGVASVSMHGSVVTTGNLTFTYFNANETLYSDYGCVCFKKRTDTDAYKAPLVDADEFRRTGETCMANSKEGNMWAVKSGYSFCSAKDGTAPLIGSSDILSYDTSATVLPQLSVQCSMHAMEL